MAKVVLVKFPAILDRRECSCITSPQKRVEGAGWWGGQNIDFKMDASDN